MYKSSELSNERTHADIGIVDDSVMIRVGANPHIGGMDHSASTEPGNEPGGRSFSGEGVPWEPPGDNGEKGPSDEGHGRGDDAAVVNRVSFTGAGIGEQIATGGDHHEPHSADEDPSPPSNIDNEGDPPDHQGELGPDDSPSDNHHVHFTGGGIGERIATRSAHDGALAADDGQDVFTGAGHASGHVPSDPVLTTESAVRPDDISNHSGFTTEDRNEALAEASGFLAGVHNADEVPGSLANEMPSQDFGDSFSLEGDGLNEGTMFNESSGDRENTDPGTEGERGDFTDASQGHQEEGDGVTNGSDNHDTDNNNEHDTDNKEPETGPTDDMPNPDDGPGNPSSMPNPDGDGGDGNESNHRGASVGHGDGTSLGSLGGQLAAVGNSQEGSNGGGGSHGPYDPGEEMPNPESGGNSPTSNVAHGGSFWDQAAAATQGGAAGAHLSAAAVSDMAGLNLSATPTTAHDFFGAHPDTSAHSEVGAHEIGLAGADLQAGLGTATFHDSVALSGSSFAHQMHV